MKALKYLGFVGLTPPNIAIASGANSCYEPPMRAPPTHSKVIGYLFWFFGFTGAHRFYYGRPVTGVIWLLTLGLLGIGWVVDMFLIPGMDDAANRRYQAGRYDYSVAWILQAFLGPLGIHRMYIGKIGTGLLWLFTGGLLGLGWLYDFCTLNEQVDARNHDAWP